MNGIKFIYYSFYLCQDCKRVFAIQDNEDDNFRPKICPMCESQVPAEWLGRTWQGFDKDKLAV